MTAEPQSRHCGLCGKLGAVSTCVPSELPRLQIVFLTIGPKLCCDDCRESIRLERAVAAATVTEEKTR
jgi:hypothetical protein